MRLSHVTCPATVLVTLFCLNGCGKMEKPKDVFDMGEKVKVGSLTYNVLEAVWKQELSAFPTNRVPERNFLLVRVTVTNSGGTDRSIPGLVLSNSKGDTYPESTDGSGVDRWLGVIRRLSPAGTEEGWLLFDVPTNSYKLRVADSDDDGTERTALINLPLKLDPNM